MLRTLPRYTLDILACAALLALCCWPFRAALDDPALVPAGRDLMQHFSRESVTRAALTAGVFPLWNPYEFSGFPAQADPHATVLYPPSILLRTLPLALSLTWTVILHLWLFGLGAYVLCRTCGVSRPAACIAAAALLLGGITMPRVHAGHYDLLRTAAWIPLALALAIQSIDRASLRPRLSLALTLACLLVSGYLQLVAYTFALIGLYAVFSMLWPRNAERTWRHAGQIGLQVAAVFAAAAGLAAFQLLPTALLSQSAGRAEGLPYISTLEGTVGMRDLALLMTPAWHLSSIEWESWETASYIGLLLPAIAPLAWLIREHRRIVVFLTLYGSLALALATATPLYQLHHWLLPMFRVPGRFNVFWAVAVAVLGALALDRLAWRQSSPGRRAWIRVAWAVPTLTTAAAVVVLDLSIYASHFIQFRRLHDAFATVLPFTPAGNGRVLSLCENRVHALELAALGIPTIDGYNSYFLADYARLAYRARGLTPPEHTAQFPRIGATPEMPDLLTLNQLNVTEIISCAPLEHEALRLSQAAGPFFLYENVRAGARVTGVDCPADMRVDLQRVDALDGRLRFTVSSSAACTLDMAEPYIRNGGCGSTASRRRCCAHTSRCPRSASQPAGTSSSCGISPHA